MSTQGDEVAPDTTAAAAAAAEPEDGVEELSSSPRNSRIANFDLTAQAAGLAGLQPHAASGTGVPEDEVGGLQLDLQDATIINPRHGPSPDTPIDPKHSTLDNTSSDSGSATSTPFPNQGVAVTDQESREQDNTVNARQPADSASARHGNDSSTIVQEQWQLQDTDGNAIAAADGTSPPPSPRRISPLTIMVSAITATVNNVVATPATTADVATATAGGLPSPMLTSAVTATADSGFAVTTVGVAITTAGDLLGDTGTGSNEQEVRERRPRGGFYARNGGWSRGFRVWGGGYSGF